MKNTVEHTYQEYKREYLRQGYKIMGFEEWKERNLQKLKEKTGENK